MLGVTIDKARMHIEVNWRITGSVFQQTRAADVRSVETHLQIDSDSDPQLVAAAIRNARGGCFAGQAIKNPVDLIETASLNGGDFDPDDYPATPIRRHADGE